MFEKKIRVLIAKPGMDGHDRGPNVPVLNSHDFGNLS
jgi:methylmalonyl-CoA mutase cobalamin-binding domain/chain